MPATRSASTTAVTPSDHHPSPYSWVGPANNKSVVESTTIPASQARVMPR